MTNTENQHSDPLVLDSREDAIVANTKAPNGFGAFELFGETAWIIRLANAFPGECRDPLGFCPP